MKTVDGEVNMNLGIPWEYWLWMEEHAISRARENGKKPAKKVLVREALDLLRAQERK